MACQDESANLCPLGGEEEEENPLKDRHCHLKRTLVVAELGMDPLWPLVIKECFMAMNLLLLILLLPATLLLKDLLP